MKPGLGEEIEGQLRPLVGLPLSDMRRVSILGWQIIEFGEQKPDVNRKGQAITRADWTVRISCHWRIVDPFGEEVLSNERPNGDQAASYFERMEAESLIVESIRGYEDGSVLFVLAEGYQLLIDARLDQGGEQWRLLPPAEGTDYVVGKQKENVV